MTGYTYDEVGNRLTKTEGTDIWEYAYNELYQLKEIRKNEQLEYGYSYDDLGRQDEERYYEYPNDVQKEMLRQEFTYFDSGMLENVKITTDPTGTNDKIKCTSDSSNVL